MARSVAIDSPDLNLVCYKIWDVIQQRDRQSWVHNVDEVRQHLLNVSHCMDHSIINKAINDGCGHIRACVQTNYGHLTTVVTALVFIQPLFLTYNAIFKLYPL